jgi:hypothetical protein
MPTPKKVKAVAKKKTATGAKPKAKPKAKLMAKAKIISAGEDY